MIGLDGVNADPEDQAEDDAPDGIDPLDVLFREAQEKDSGALGSWLD